MVYFYIKTADFKRFIYFVNISMQKIFGFWFLPKFKNERDILVKFESKEINTVIPQ